MNDLRGVRKSKGMTMEQLAKKSGVSAKTISLYETTPPKRPSQKVMGRISSALGISSDALLGAIGLKKKPAKGAAVMDVPDAIELSDHQVVRIQVLIDKELQELHMMMIETASLAEEIPAMAKSMEYLSNDIDLLTDIRQRLS